MVGTGVFTSLGFQAAEIRSPGVLLLIWLFGGVFSLCGALSYAELSTALPRSGGEFNFLSRIYHPAIGFMAGWASVIVGFAAPLALASMAFGKYCAAAIPGVSPLLASIAVTLIASMAHAFRLQFGATFQNTFTSLKLLLILGFIVAGMGSPHAVNLLPKAGDLPQALGAPFAISLIYVMFAYSGWNASVYIAQEVSNPKRNIPRSLFIGTLLVTILYVALNAIFLLTTPLGELAGQLEVGALSAKHIFGQIGGRLVSGLVALALISSISAMTWAGPRVWQVMGEDYSNLRILAKKSATGIPVTAILVQLAIVVLLLVTSTFEVVLVYTQFTLNLCALLTVLGVFILRRTQPALERPYRVWGYPFTPLAFLLIIAATMLYFIGTKPLESLAGLITLGIGFLLYLFSPRTNGAQFASLISARTVSTTHEHQSDI